MFDFALDTLINTVHGLKDCKLLMVNSRKLIYFTALYKDVHTIQ